MTRRAILLLVVVPIVSTPPLTAAEQGEIEALLSHPVVGDVQPLAEIQRYCQVRVPRVPPCETAAQWRAQADRLRKAVLDQIVFRGEAARWRDAKTKVQWLETIPGGPGYRIKKLRYEALPGMWIPALLYEPEQLSGRVPAILNVNGHSREGKVYKPKQLRSINQAKRGMLALNLEWLGMGQLRTDGFAHVRMNQLDLCGTSGLAPFYLCMWRGLDLLVSLEHADPERVAVTGLSGGGWQTIILSSLDTRVKLANPVAGYSSYRTRAMHLKDLGDSEQTPNDLATLVDYTHLTAMMAPRPTLLTYNSKDNCCFESGYALEPLLNAAAPVFRLLDAEDALRYHVNDDPGTHNYEHDNREAFYRMLGDFFFPGDDQFERQEIPSEDELKTAEELLVELPDKNEDFNTLALGLAKNLPRDAELPKQQRAARQWQKSRRASLRALVRAKDYAVQASDSGRQTKAGLEATFWWLQMDEDWTLPAVELVQGDPKSTAILVADRGRSSTAADAAGLLAAGHRVLAVDTTSIGECEIKEKGWLFPLLIAAVGDRPLGLEASQLAAVARWSVDKHQTGPVTLCARGPRTAAVALVAAALEQEAIGRVELDDSLGSLKEVIEENRTVREMPELFCFGLLELFDIKHLAALVAPRPVIFHEPSDRAKTELADLAPWYRLLGSPFEPYDLGRDLP